VPREEEVCAYERLRRHAVCATEGLGGNQGEALLVNRGMFAWLRALESYVPVGSASANKVSLSSLEVPSDLSAEITQILTNMVFAVRS
jgi:hypothetical protein